MNFKVTCSMIILVFLFPFVAFAENIDPDNDDSQYAWGENVGWINFEPSQGEGVTVTDSAVTGKAWGENIGWINLNPATGGVANDGAGNLSGYAWGENVGWISFSCENTGICNSLNYGVTINPATGAFSGKAWGENIGWINFVPDGKPVKTSWREDLCPGDPNKTEPGICGCGVSDTDSDGDGTPNCNDGCPNDPNKVAQGVCGCSVADTDSDGDGTADCIDGCPNDPNKTQPGICGCGKPDTDSDNDGIKDCIDNCPTIANPDQRDRDGDGKGNVCDEMQVPVDIKPQTCPNSININATSVLPVAILGTSGFDVTEIDPSSIRLENVAPVRYATMDVATPYIPFIGKTAATDCTTAGSDGITDLTLKFNTKDIGAAIGSVTNREVRVLHLTGKLLDGTPILGEDVVVILKK